MLRTRATLAFAIALTTVATTAHAQSERSGPHFSLAGTLGGRLPADALKYGWGVGVKGSLQLGLLYTSAGVIFQDGDETFIGYGGAPAIGLGPGVQSYEVKPAFFVGDAGVAIPLPIAGRTTLFAPYVSAGALLLNVKTKGTYGTSSLSQTRFALGWGILYRVPVVAHLGLGLEYRMYPLGDADFEFGTSPDAIKHGFSTSIFYHALFGEVSYTF